MHQCIYQPINKIQHHFNRASLSYDDHCQLQKVTGSRLIHLCNNHQPQAESILDLGCGTGITTEQLAKSYRYKKFHAIDISTSLLMRAKERLEPYHINVYEKDFDELTSINYFNLIFSNMALHWSLNVNKTLRHIRHLLSAEGHIAFSIPLVGTLSELKNNYSINSFFDSSMICSFLHTNKFKIKHHYQEQLTYSFSSTLEALTSLKKVGANHVNRRIHSGLRSHLQPVHQLTYVIGYFIAKRNSK